uniref:Trihelix transcription factor GT-1-like isoform X3 n=1 Tax=Rhizophora mucronata TaxID=61149 RepID=A0A2P2L206_RHIMU
MSCATSELCGHVQGSYYYSSFAFLVNFGSTRCTLPSVDFFFMQLLRGQLSILKDVWIMMDILLRLLQLMQLQLVEFLLGIGGRPLELVLTVSHTMGG